MAFIQFVLMVLAVYGMVPLFVAMGSQHPWTGKILIKNPLFIAAVITVLIIGGWFWPELWGQLAWPAFFVLVAILFFVGRWLLSLVA
jgi:hypothetical protein